MLNSNLTLYLVYMQLFEIGGINSKAIKVKKATMLPFKNLSFLRLLIDSFF